MILREGRRVFLMRREKIDCLELSRRQGNSSRKAEDIKANCV
jgi:hypothetical protein